MEDEPTEGDATTTQAARRKRWPQLLAEGLAIILSILIAFSLDAAWDYRLDRVREREILQALTAEFTVSQAALTQNRQGEEAQIDALRRLLSLSPDALRAMSTDQAYELAIVFSHEPFEPVQAELEAVLASGQFELLRDAGLRRALGGWRVLLQQAGRQAQAERDFVVNLLNAAEGSGVPSALASGSDELPERWATLTADSAFRDVGASSLLVRQSYVQTYLPRLENTVARVLGLLTGSP